MNSDWVPAIRAGFIRAEKGQGTSIVPVLLVLLNLLASGNPSWNVRLALTVLKKFHPVLA
jgi:hypothetical protein